MNSDFNNKASGTPLLWRIGGVKHTLAYVHDTKQQ